MQKSLFYKLGTVVYHMRWFIIALWLLGLLASIPLLPHIMSPFKTTGFIDEHSKSAEAQAHINHRLGYDNANKILILYRSKHLLTSNPLFLEKIKKSLRQLEKFPIAHDIILPEGKHQISKDKHTAYAVIIIKSKIPMSNELLTQFKRAIKKPSQMTLLFGGEPVFEESVSQQTQEDLFRADLIAAPVTLITLFFVFGSLVAALLPIILGAGCALMILGTLYCLGHVFTLSVFTLNIALLLGLCLSLDYALLIINRFREELGQEEMKTSIAMTQASAGKAIFFSGFAVLVSLSALFIFPISILFSVAVGGVVAVCCAIITALFVLPAMLSVLKKHINTGAVALLKPASHGRAWRWFANKIVRRPFVYGTMILVILLTLGYPFLFVKFGVSDYHIFPEHSEETRFFTQYAKSFDEKQLSPILLTVDSLSSTILTPSNVKKLYRLAGRLKENSRIQKVYSIVTIDDSLKLAQYLKLYSLPKKAMPKPFKQVLDRTTKKYFTLFTLVGEHPSSTQESDKLINQLRNMKSPNPLRIQIAGVAASNMDVLNSIAVHLPYALLWIFISTYLILLVLLRSLFLPFKAIVMTLLSLCACYGALVLVFQEGYLHQWLHFQPQGMLDISLLVIIFCALFGFSMDYEVFLLTRIKESYDATHDNEKSIVFGIEKSSRIITCAALIVIFICGSFLVAEVLMVKAFGLGIAVAIFVDAFLIRTILVPSAMTIFKSWNWYLPRWLDRLLPKL